MNKNGGRNYFNLVIGIAFTVYGTYRLSTFYRGAEYNTFRIIIAVGFVVLGIWDLYKFFKTPSGKTE